MRLCSPKVSRREGEATVTFFKNAKTQNLLDVVLEGKTEEFRRRVLDLVVKTGLEPDDPIFLVLLATGRLEVLLEESPLALERLFKGWTSEIKRSLDLVEQVTLEQQKSAIALCSRGFNSASGKERRATVFYFFDTSNGGVALLCGNRCIVGDNGSPLDGRGIDQRAPPHSRGS